MKVTQTRQQERPLRGQIGRQRMSYTFRMAVKLMCIICHVRVLGKITVVDDKGRRW